MPTVLFRLQRRESVASGIRVKVVLFSESVAAAVSECVPTVRNRQLAAEAGVAGGIGVRRRQDLQPVRRLRRQLRCRARLLALHRDRRVPFAHGRPVTAIRRSLHSLIAQVPHTSSARKFGRKSIGQIALGNGRNPRIQFSSRII